MIITGDGVIHDDDGDVINDDDNDDDDFLWVTAPISPPLGSYIYIICKKSLNTKIHLTVFEILKNYVQFLLHPGLIKSKSRM